MFTVPTKMSALTMGEIREIIVKSLASPTHIGSAMEGLFERGSVLGEKRKSLVDKYSKRKRKVAIEAPPPTETAVINDDDVLLYDDYPQSSQDMW